MTRLRSHREESLTEEKQRQETLHYVEIREETYGVNTVVEWEKN